jgi:23S rRNA pseudouridine1911/1915/1917 synthase
MRGSEEGLDESAVPQLSRAGGLAGPEVSGPLLAWLLAALEPMPRARVKQLLHHGKISVNGVSTTRFDYPLQPGDCVTVANSRSGPDDLARAGVSILFADDDLMVVDKPAGLLTVASEAERSRTVFALLLAHMAERKMGRPFVVHRLDRETSGLLLFARSAVVRDKLQAGWQGVVKTYLGIVEGMPQPAEGTVRSYLTEGKDLRMRTISAGAASKLAITHYKVVGSRGPHALVELKLETGRKHQLRVHMTKLDTPIIGDKLYRATTNPANRLGLHAWRLEFDHPTTGENLSLKSPLPVVLERVIGPYPI